ncbi:MAG: PAS domain S-box protein [Deltaproteobacteria bacterium]|nr:PAS domain S-box protein [Deltaproteobacteria bacterium]
MRGDEVVLTPRETILAFEQHILTALRGPALVSPIVLVAIAVMSWRSGEMSWWTLPMVGGIALVSWGVVAPRLVHRRRVRAVVVGLCVAAVAGLFAYGPFLGVGLLFVSAAGLAAWLESGAGALLAYGTLVAAFPVAAHGVHARWLDQQIDLEAGAWLRVGMVAALLLGAFAYVMRRIRARYAELVSASYAASEALRESEARFAGLFERAPDALIIVDERGRIVQANLRAEAMFGYARAELVGMLAETIFATEGAAFRACGEPRTIGGGADVFAQRGDGEQLPVEVMISPIELAGGRLVVAAVRDLTERVRLTAQLQHSQRMEALGTLAGGVAHDFNNLLAAIAMNTELAQKTDDPGALRANLDDIAAASNRAADLVRQILSFSRKNTTIRVVTSLARLIEEAARLLRASIPAGIELDVSIADDLPTVLVDGSQLHQVLMNLGTNAWQAIDRPTGRITIAASVVELPRAGSRVELPPGPYVRVSVSDDGTGMDDATVARIFEPFFTTKPVGKGTGLGLSVVHGIVANHGGAIAVDSLLGRGTMFTIHLPYGPVPRAEDEATVPAPAQRGAGCVLVVDDEALVATAVARLVRRLGYEVESFVEPAAAIAAVAADPVRFDVVLTDENMPGIGGLELARAVHALRPDMPIVLASGNSKYTKAQLAAARVRYRLDKPYDAEVLGDTLARALAEARGTAEAGERPRVSEPG